MAAGDTKLSICSDAMIMLGAAPLSSFSEGTDAAQAADRLYDDIRDTMIAQYPWAWSTKKVALARLAAAPTNEWKYAYAIAGDILGVPRALFSSSSVGPVLLLDGKCTARASLQITNLSGSTISTRSRKARCLPTFVRALKAALASAFSIPVADSSSKGDYFHALAFGPPSDNMRGGLMRVAMNIDGGLPPQAIEDFTLIAVRG
jgi:hypothetical protein